MTVIEFTVHDTLDQVFLIVAVLLAKTLDQLWSLLIAYSLPFSTFKQREQNDSFRFVKDFYRMLLSMSSGAF